MAHFLALPLVAKIVSLVGAAALFIYGFLKRKAIAVFISTGTKAVNKRFWGWAHEQMKAAAPLTPAAPARPSDERTYQGIFDWYGKPFNSKYAMFQLSQEGKTIKVPVMSTQLFTDFRSGDLVEIDTQTGVYIGEEVVLRVSKLKPTATPNSVPFPSLLQSPPSECVLLQSKGEP